MMQTHDQQIFERSLAGEIVPSRLPSPRGLRSTMKMMRCRELLAEFPVDPETARGTVAPPYPVRVSPDGHANLLLLVQECERCLLDGMLSIRPMRMAHLWVELAGPEEIGPALPGTVASLPTSYWYGLPHQMESRLATLSFRAVGVDIQPVARISTGGAPGARREGQVLEHKASGAGYAWEETTTLWQAPQLLTGRRWFYRDYGTLLRRRSVGLVVCRATFLGDGHITLRASQESAIGRLGFGTTLRGNTHAVEITCRVRIQVGRR
jgi:hypothetical protein